jgi:hypothetical protein
MMWVLRNIHESKRHSSHEYMMTCIDADDDMQIMMCMSS